MSVRTRVTEWTVQRLTPCGWIPVDHPNNPAPRFSIAVQIYLDLPAHRRRLLRDGTPLSSPAHIEPVTLNPAIFDQEKS